MIKMIFYSGKNSKEKKFYVYFHRDSDGNIFYVGKGTGKRAWSKGGHNPLWRKYIEERLHGKYTVEIFKEGLIEQKAEELESELIDKYCDQTVNWMSGRNKDYDALDRRNRLRKENLDSVKKTRSIEAIEPEKAVIKYREALEKMREYESIVYEKDTLISELTAGEPSTGDWIILDRLTLCLVKSKRFSEAIEEAEKYLNDFPGLHHIKAGERIKKRIEIARQKTTKKEK